MERLTDLPEGAKGVEMRKLESQLAHCQRPLKPKEHKFDGRWRKCHRKRRRGDEKTTAQSGRLENWWEGCKVPDCLKGLIVHSVTVMCNRLVLRIARGRRYGVTSDGNKFHGLYHQAWMEDKARKRTQRQKLQKQQEEVKQVPWNYNKQNRANMDLMLGLLAGHVTEE